MPPTLPHPAPAVIVKPNPHELHAVEQALAFYDKYNKTINAVYSDLETEPHHPSQLLDRFGRLFQANDTLATAGQRGSGVFQSPPFFDAEDTIDWISDTSKILHEVCSYARASGFSMTSPQEKARIAELEGAFQEFNRNIESDWLNYTSRNTLPAICDYIKQRGAAVPAATAPTPAGPQNPRLQEAVDQYLQAHGAALKDIHETLWGERKSQPDGSMKAFPVPGKEKEFAAIAALRENLGKIKDADPSISAQDWPQQKDLNLLGEALCDTTAKKFSNRNPGLEKPIDEALQALKSIVTAIKFKKYDLPTAGVAAPSQAKSYTPSAP